MKHSTLGSLTLFIFAALVVLLAPTRSYGVGTTFTVTIPNRPGLLPVALVKIELTVPGANSTNSTLTLTTTSGGTFDSGALTPNGIAQTLNGRNKVLFQVNSGKVTINFFPYENLQPSGSSVDKCTLQPAPVFPYVWNFAFDGPVVASAFRRGRSPSPQSTADE